MAQNYDVVVVGAGAAGVFMAYEFVKLDKNIKVCIIDQGGPVSKRKCPIDGKKVKSCIHCKVCSIMHGFGGAGGLRAASVPFLAGASVPVLLLFRL